MINITLDAGGILQIITAIGTLATTIGTVIIQVRQSAIGRQVLEAKTAANNAVTVAESNNSNRAEQMGRIEKVINEKAEDIKQTVQTAARQPEKETP